MSSRTPSLHLSMLAEDLLEATASEAYCQRVSSLCGDLTDRKHNCTTNALEKLVFLKVNSSVLEEF